MNFRLMKFVLRINGGISCYILCSGNRVVQQQYVIITSGLTAVAPFGSWFYSKKCGSGLRTG